MTSGNWPRNVSGYITLGLTEAQYTTKIRTEISTRRPFFGSWCSHLSAIEVVHGFARPITVYLSSELTEGSCKYDATFNHELVHVRIHEDGLRAAKEEIERAVLELSDHGPVVGDNADALYDELNTSATEIIRAAAARVLAMVEKRNALIDTPDSYEALRLQCPT